MILVYIDGETRPSLCDPTCGHGFSAIPLAFELGHTRKLLKTKV